VAELGHGRYAGAEAEYDRPRRMGGAFLKDLKGVGVSGGSTLQNVHKQMGCEVAFGNVLVDTSASKTTRTTRMGSTRGGGTR
jgi:hypothetical protein